jgi:hypothetical protein
MAAAARLLELLLVPPHAHCRARRQRLPSITARRRNSRRSASSVLVKFPGGEALSVAAILEAPGEVVAMGGSEHLLVLGFTNAVSATHRKEWLH